MEPSDSQPSRGKGKGKERQGHDDASYAPGSSTTTGTRIHVLGEEGVFGLIKPPGERFFLPNWHHPRAVELAWQANQPLFAEQKREAITELKRQSKYRGNARTDLGPRVIGNNTFTASTRKVAGYLSMRTNVEFLNWLTEADAVSYHFKHFLELRESSFGCGDVDAPLIYQFTHIARLSVHVNIALVTDDQREWPPGYPPNAEGFPHRLCLSFMRLAYNVIRSAQTNMLSRRAFSGPVHPLLSRTYLGMEAEDLNRVLEAHKHHYHKAGTTNLMREQGGRLLKPLWMELPLFFIARHEIDRGIFDGSDDLPGSIEDGRSGVGVPEGSDNLPGSAEDDQSGVRVIDGSDNLPGSARDGQSGVGLVDGSGNQPVATENGQSEVGIADGSRDHPIILGDSPSSAHEVHDFEDEIDEQWGSAFNNYTEAERDAMMELDDQELMGLYKKWESEYGPRLERGFGF